MLENIFLGRFIKASLAKGAELKRVTIPLDTITWLHTIHYSFPSISDVYGLGSDVDEKLAYIKAVVEFYERKAFFDIGEPNGFKSTNGIAGHRLYFLAKKAAVSELYERDSFLCHWYSKTPFIQIENQVSTTLPTIKELESKNIKAKFFKTYLGLQETYVCFLVNLQTGGFAVGLSSGKLAEQNFIKSFSEALINYFLGNQGFSKEELLADLKVNGLSSLKNHRTLWLHEKTLPEWILNLKDPRITSPLNIQPKMIRTFKTSFGPIKVVGLELSEIISLGLGYPSKIELSLLEKRFGRDTTHHSFEETDPHPIP